MKTATLLVILCAVTWGCVTYYPYTPTSARVQIDSNPKYATIYTYDGKRIIGTCPTSIVFPISETDRLNGTAIGPGVRVKWLSGAEVSAPNITVKVNNSPGQVRPAYLLNAPEEYSMVYDRPIDAPRPEIDARYVLEKQRSDALQEQAAAATKAADAAQDAADAEAQNAYWNRVRTQQEIKAKHEADEKERRSRQGD